MKIFKIDLNIKPDDFELIPIFDIHFGTVFHDEKLFNKVVKYIQENENAYWFCGGDVCEFINTEDKRFEYSTLERSFQDNLERVLTYSVEYATAKLEPIAHKCLFMISGNHDAKYRGKFGFDPISSICKNLNIKNYTDCYEALVKILFHHGRTTSFDIYTHHGHGCASVRIGSLLNRLEDAMANYDADIFIMGHSHQLVFTYKNCLKLNNNGTKLIKRQKLLLRVGGFRFGRKKGVLGYEERFGLRPNATGTYIIKTKLKGIPEKNGKSSHLELGFTAIPFI